MSSSDDLRRALAQLAAEDVEEVVEEARAGARVRARELIEEALVDELVAAAGRREVEREATAPVEGNVLWAYCVLSAADASSLPAIEGLEGGSVVETVVHGDLAALVSAVPLAEYGDEHLREHLNDIDWVERTARAHEAVLDRALAECTIVPLRLCTLFHDRDGVTKLLRDERDSLAEGLRALAGRAEWGLKVFVDPERVQVDPPAGDDDDGAGYIARKQRERQAREAESELVSGYAAEAHERLAGVADAARANPVQRPEAHGRSGDMILNGVYLVRLEREAELMRVVDELRSQWADSGVDLELTGPWPGYNFASGAEAVTS